jgi:hypothetical protein
MQRGDRRGAGAARRPRSSSPLRPCIHASVQASIYMCDGRLVCCVRVRMLGRVCEGVGREGKQEVRREEGMGEADIVIAGYSWRVCCRVCACVCVRACAPVCACAHMCVLVFVQGFIAWFCARSESSRIEARRDACSVQTISGYLSRRDGAGYTGAAHAAAASQACAGAQPALRVTDAPPSRPPPVLRRRPQRPPRVRSGRRGLDRPLRRPARHPALA